MEHKATQLVPHHVEWWYLLVLWLQHLPLVHFSFSVAQVSDRNIRMPNHHGDTLSGSLTEPCEQPFLPRTPHRTQPCTPHPCCLATVVPLDFLYVQADSLKRNFATGTGTQLSLLHCTCTPHHKGRQTLGQVKGDDDKSLVNAMNSELKTKSVEVQCGVTNMTIGSTC